MYLQVRFTHMEAHSDAGWEITNVLRIDFCGIQVWPCDSAMLEYEETNELQKIIHAASST